MEEYLNMKRFALSGRVPAISIFFLAYAVRLAMVVLLHPYRDMPDYEVLRIMRSLARGGMFADPFAPLATGPTAHVSPLYPLVMSMAFRIFGDGPGGMLVHCLVNLAIASLGYALLPGLARTLCLPASYGIAGGVLGALLPVNFINESRTIEGVVCCLFTAITIPTLDYWRTGIVKTSLAMRLGVLWGLVWLTSATGLLIFVALGMASWLLRPAGRRILIRNVALTGAVAFTMLIPWAVRNQRVLGRPIFLRDNFGLELQVSNNDLTGVSIEENYSNGTLDTFHPYSNRDEALKVRSLGEVEYNRLKLDEAFHYISLHPIRFVGLTLGRIGDFWFPMTGRPMQSAILWVLTALSFVGLTLVWRENRDAAAVFLCIWAVVQPLYCVVQTSVRYRYQIQWTVFALAGARAYASQ